MEFDNYGNEKNYENFPKVNGKKKLEEEKKRKKRKRKRQALKMGIMKNNWK